MRVIDCDDALDRALAPGVVPDDLSVAAIEDETSVDDVLERFDHVINYHGLQIVRTKCDDDDAALFWVERIES